MMRSFFFLFSFFLSQPSFSFIAEASQEFDIRVDQGKAIKSVEFDAFKKAYSECRQWHFWCSFDGVTSEKINQSGAPILYARAASNPIVESPKLKFYEEFTLERVYEIPTYASCYQIKSAQMDLLKEIYQKCLERPTSYYKNQLCAIRRLPEAVASRTESRGQYDVNIITIRASATPIEILP